jgi:hypothetical protein
MTDIEIAYHSFILSTLIALCYYGLQQPFKDDEDKDG